MADAGIGPWPRNRFHESTRQDVLDAAAELQVRRRQVAEALAGGDTTDGKIVARGNEGINVWMYLASSNCAELLSVRPTATVAQLIRSLPNNRAELARGMRMVSVFDYYSLDPDARLILTGETDGSYAFGVAPVQMKIFDGERVVLQGPFIEGEPTVMALSSPGCLAVARAYRDAVLASSFPAVETGQGLDQLTERQRQIVALLATDARDEAVAAALGVSVRTVRGDVASLMTLLGVRSRFAAGLRIRRQVSAEAR
jgi:DNA-binding CsgD family transcriptional regulator